MTARWVVDVVAPERNLAITWQPISLLRKNQPDPESEYYHYYVRTHKMLRVMESVRASEGDGAVFVLYWELGSRIHHDEDRDFDIRDALASAGFSLSHADAWEDDSWDAVIGERMDAGLALVGEDVGTPIIAIDSGPVSEAATGDASDGGSAGGSAGGGAGESGEQRVGIFGPVITRVPDREDSLALWDAIVTMARIPGFWELKRTRTERPDFGRRPESHVSAAD